MHGDEDDEASRALGNGAVPTPARRRASSAAEGARRARLAAASASSCRREGGCGGTLAQHARAPSSLGETGQRLVRSAPGVGRARSLGAAAQRSHSRVRPPRATRALHLRRGVEEAAKGTHGREALQAHSAWSTEARGEASELSRARSAPAPALPPPCEFVRFRFQTVQNFTSKGSIKGSNFTCTLTTEERLASSRQNAPSRVAAPRPMGTYVASELPPPHPSVPPSRASPCRSSAARGGRNVPACVSNCAEAPPVRRSRGPASPPSNAPRCPERRVPSAEFGAGWLRVLSVGFIHLEGMRNSF